MSQDVGKWWKIMRMRVSPYRTKETTEIYRNRGKKRNEDGPRDKCKKQTRMRQRKEKDGNKGKLGKNGAIVKLFSIKWNALYVCMFAMCINYTSPL